MDEKESAVTADTFALTLHQGENAISVTPVNDVGRRGSEARIVFLLP